MRKLLGVGAILLGTVGVLLCVAAIGLSWLVAVKAVSRIDRVAARLDQGLSEADVRLAHVETRVKAVRSTIEEVRVVTTAIATEDVERPRVRVETERLLGQLVPALDRAETIADTLGSVAGGLHTASDVVDQLADKPDATVRVRKMADTIDRAAEELKNLRTRVDALKSAKTVQLTQFKTLAGDAVASSARLAESLADVRQEINVVRGRTAERRDQIVFWVYTTAAVLSLLWLWGGFGQLCLISWGRRCISTPSQTISHP
jgi:chromosome segregation ATPase